VCARTRAFANAGSLSVIDELLVDARTSGSCLACSVNSIRPLDDSTRTGQFVSGSVSRALMLPFDVPASKEPCVASARIVPFDVCRFALPYSPSVSIVPFDVRASTSPLSLLIRIGPFDVRSRARPSTSSTRT